MITLTTVGFGDYVPSHAESRAVVFFFAAGGLGLLGILLNSVGDFVSAHFDKAVLARVKRLNDRLHDAKSKGEGNSDQYTVDDALEAPEPVAPGPLFQNPQPQDGAES